MTDSFILPDDVLCIHGWIGPWVYDIIRSSWNERCPDLGYSPPANERLHDWCSDLPYLLWLVNLSQIYPEKR